MRGPWIQGARREEPGGVLDSTLRTPTERNAEDAGLSRAAAGRWWEMQANVYTVFDCGTGSRSLRLARRPLRKEDTNR